MLRWIRIDRCRLQYLAWFRISLLAESRRMADDNYLDLSGWKHGSHENQMDLPSSPIGEQNSLWQTLSSSSDDSTSVSDTHDARHYSPQNKDAQSAAFQLPTDEPAVLYSGYAPFAVTDVNDLWLRACGFSRDEVIGQTMRIIQGSGTEWDLIDSLMSNVRRRQPFSTALTNYTKTRQPFRHELRVVPLDTADGLNGPHFLARSRIAVHVEAGMEFASRDPSGLSAGWAHRGARAHDGPVVAEAGGRRRAGSARRTAGGGTRASVAP